MGVGRPDAHLGMVATSQELTCAAIFSFQISSQQEITENKSQLYSNRGRLPPACGQTGIITSGAGLGLSVCSQVGEESLLCQRDITLPTKVPKVKAMVFPVVMYGCESWPIKKAEC